jgi:hypothetical protein
VFYNNAGVLSVGLNLINDEGVEVWDATRTNSADDATTVGGARYQWLIYVNGSFSFDNQSLERVEVTPQSPQSKDDCKDDAFAAFGFKNQGQCIASLVANEKAGK